MDVQGGGSFKAGLLADNRNKLKQAKQHARELSLTINTTKRQIDALKASEEAASSQQVSHLTATIQDLELMLYCDFSFRKHSRELCLAVR